MIANHRKYFIIRIYFTSRAIFYAFEALRKVHSLESIEIDTDFLVSQYISDIIACTKHIGKPQQLKIPKDFGKKAE